MSVVMCEVWIKRKNAGCARPAILHGVCMSHYNMLLRLSGEEKKKQRKSGGGE